MKYWYDTEFLDDGKTIELVSIGMVAEDGRELYAESTDVDLSKANDWVKENVLPHLWSRQLDVSPAKIAANEWSRDGGTGGLLSRRMIAGSLLSFVGQDEKPEFYNWYGAYDHVALCQLYGPMILLPKGWPMFSIDLKQWCYQMGDPHVPKQNSAAHHALEDARHNKEIYDFLKDYEKHLHRTRM